MTTIIKKYGYIDQKAGSQCSEANRDFGWLDQFTLNTSNKHRAMQSISIRHAIGRSGRRKRNNAVRIAQCEAKRHVTKDLQRSRRAAR